MGKVLTQYSLLPTSASPDRGPCFPETRLLLAGLRVVQFTPLLPRRCVLVRSQEAFHFLDGQNRNEIGDVCPFFKLVCGVTQHPFNLG